MLAGTTSSVATARDMTTLQGRPGRGSCRTDIEEQLPRAGCAAQGQRQQHCDPCHSGHFPDGLPEGTLRHILLVVFPLALPDWDVASSFSRMDRQGGRQQSKGAYSCVMASPGAAQTHLSGLCKCCS